MKKLTLSFICLLFSVIYSFGQNEHFLGDYQYTNLKNIFISHNSNIIYTIFQDRQGLMWFGTKTGLYSFDGRQTQDHIRDYELQGNSIYSIVQVKPYLFAIGAEKGFMLYNLKTDSYESPSPALSKLIDIRCMLLINNIFYIGTGNMGLCRFDITTNKLEQIKIDGRIDNSRTYSLEADNENLYIGSYSGLSVYNFKTKKRTAIDIPTKISIVHALKFDNSKKDLWIGTETNLIKYDKYTREKMILKDMEPNSYKSLSYDKSDNLIIGTDNGVYIYNTISKTSRHITHNTDKSFINLNKVIWSTFIDKENNMWLGTEHGICFSSNNSAYRFVHINELSEKGDGNNFSSYLADKDGSFWFCGNNGLLHYNKQTKKWDWFSNKGIANLYIPNNHIHSIYQDKQGLVWIATDNGVLWYEASSNRFYTCSIFDKTKKRNAYWAYDLLEDEHNRLWIATYSGGLFVVDKSRLISSKGKTYLAEHNITFQGENVYQLKKDLKGNFWASAQRGLTRINPNTMQMKIYGVWMDYMTIDDDNKMWYSTMGRIYSLDLDNMKRRKIDYQLHHNTVTCMTVENKHLWFASSDGAYTMDCNDGIVYSLPIPSYFYACVQYEPKNNKILFGGEDGIMTLSPDIAYGQATSSSPIVITAIKSNGKILLPHCDYQGDCVRYINHVSLPYSNKNLTFEFSDFNYSEDYKRLLFRLDGTNSSWNQLEMGENSISFANLSPGTHTLQLKYASYKGKVDGQISEFSFTILPPWYLSIWAYIVYMIFFLSVLLFVARYIWMIGEKRLDKREKEKTFELTRLKMDFFTNISHELKTPLTLIIGPISSLISKTTNASQKMELMDIQKNAMRLNSLIHKILDIRQIQSDSDDKLFRTHVELNSFINNIIHLFYSTFEQRDITVNTSSNCESLWMNLDMLKMESVAINIISNALKYLPEHGGKMTIEINKSDADKKVNIYFKDNGCGIEKKELPYVFIRFFRGEDNQKSDVQGTGIGLFLVKKYTELHGGDVKISSEVDKGTSICISLPLLGDNIISESREYRIEDDETTSDKRHTILLIDDNQEILSFLSRSLSQKQRCITARNGIEGLEKVKENRVNLVIVDEMMPGLSGMQFCRQFRKLVGYSNVPIVMLTAKDDRKTELESIEVGVDAFISKPFDIDKLSMRIEQMIRSRCLIEESLRIKNYTEAIPEVRAEDDDSNEKFLYELTSIIEKNMECPDFNVSMLNENMEMDAKSLYRRLKNITGMTPVNYIRKIRLKKAAVLLKQKRFSTSEVMYMVGYSNASYFTKCFTEEYGVTPKKYAQE